MSDKQRFVPEDTAVGCIPRERLYEASGLELMREIISGKSPQAPISRVLNFKLTAADSGMVEFRGVPLSDHYNPAGTVHGGWAATLLDSALGASVNTMVPAGMGHTTIEFKVNLVRPINVETGEVICRGEVTHFGRTTAVSEATLKTADGKLLALGTETCALFPLPERR